MTTPTKPAAGMPEEIYVTAYEGDGSSDFMADRDRTIYESSTKYIRADHHSEMVEAFNDMQDAMKKYHSFIVCGMPMKEYDDLKGKIAVLNAIIEGK